MKIGHGTIAKSLNLTVDTPLSDQSNLDELLITILDKSYADWEAAGSKRAWNQKDGAHVLIIGGGSYEMVIKRLRSLAKERGFSLRIGKPMASEHTSLYIPILALDPPPARPKEVRSVESSAFMLSGDDWGDILFALRYVIQHVSDPRRDDLARLESRIISNQPPASRAKMIER